MKITSVPQLYRNLRRFREIAAVLRRYGLADGLTRFRLPFRDWAKDRDGIALSQYTSVQRVRLALTELGPTFIKLGQLLATRPDLVGRELAEELKHLRSNVRPDPFETVEETLRAELGNDFDSHFSDIQREPLACASIGQVHRGTLNDGTPVVLKIRRSGIHRIVTQDIEIIGGLAQLAMRVESLAAWSPTEMVEQLAPIIRRELDFRSERLSLRAFADIFAKSSLPIVIPEPIDHLCTQSVLVMQRIEGTPLSQWAIGQAALAEITGDTADGTQSANRPIGQAIAAAYLSMVMDHSIFHADPHSGNLIVMDDHRVGILDFGMVGRIDPILRETLEDMLVAIVEGDQNRLTRHIRRIGRAPASLDESKLATDAVEFIATYSRQELGEFDLTSALNDLSGILHKHRIKLPHQSALLLKMLISLEGTLRELNVDFDSLEAVGDLVRKSMLRRLSPVRRLRNASRVYLEAERFLEIAPDEALALMGQVRRGDLSVTLQHRRLSPSINRLVLGVMSSAVFLGSAIMLATNVPPRLFTSDPTSSLHNLSLLGLVGLAGSITVMLWLLIAINRSGHLTRGGDEDSGSPK